MKFDKTTDCERNKEKNFMSKKKIFLSECNVFNYLIMVLKKNV